MKGWSGQELREILKGEWYKEPASESWQAKDFAINILGVVDPDTVFVAIDPETWRKSSGNTSIYEGSNDVHGILKSTGDKIGGIIARQPIPELDVPQLVVGNTYDIFQKMALSVRHKMTGIIISVTETEEKSAVKNMLVYCVGGDYSLVCTKEDFNTDTGIYLAMAKCVGNPDFCVLEVGMSALRMSGGSISNWIKPHICVITDVKIGRNAFYKTKVCEGMEPGGVAVLNSGMTQFGYVRAEVVKYGAKPVSYGMDPSNDSYAVSLERTGQFMKIKAVVLGEELRYALPLTSKTVLLDSLAVLTVMKLSGLDIQALSEKLSGYPSNDCISRAARIKVPGGRVTLLDDCYEGRASSSLSTALEILNEEAGKNSGEGRKIAVFGGAGDLEEARPAELLAASGMDILFGYGEDFQSLSDRLPKGMAMNVYTDAESLAGAVCEYIRGRDCLLLRGPRADAGLSKVLDAVASIADGMDGAAGGDGAAGADGGAGMELLASEPRYGAEAVEEIQTPAYSVYSLDKMVMLQSGGVDRRIDEGLGSVLLLNFVLQLLCEKRIALADETVIQNRAPEDRNQRNSIGLEFQDQVSAGQLLEALVVLNAPDAILALGDFLNQALKRPLRQSLNEMARRLKLSSDVFKNITGRKDSRVEQGFFLEDLFKIAVEIFSLPMEGLKLLKTVFTVYRGRSFESASVLHGADDVMYYYCFGDQSYHAAALAKIGEERVCVCVCGARTPYERDAAVCRILFANQKKISVVSEPVWRPVGDSQERGVVTVAGNTYFGDGTDPLPEEADAFLSEGDFNIINFEAVLTRLKTSPFQRYLERVHREDPKRAAAELKACHVHGVMLANGHSMDYGGNGCRQTLRIFRAEQILTVGSGRNVNEAEKPLFLMAGGCRVIFFNVCVFEETRRWQYALGASPGAACLSDSYRAALRDYRSQYPDAFIIVSPHWGSGFLDRMDEARRIAAQLVADGADCVVGHGAHEISGFETVRGKFVLYSLGDFVFNHDTGTDGQSYGCVAKLCFSDDSVEVRVYPIAVRGESGRLRPHPVEVKDFQSVAQMFQIPSSLGKMDERGYYFSIQIPRVKYHADSKDS
jgi:UDP-N-acetylmuramyl pentapeptide synthase